MSHERIQLGKKGEELACLFLENLGYKIQERNFRNHLGEIDLIAWDGDILCFVEVKTRQTLQYGTPFEAVDRYKQHKIILMAKSYLVESELWDEVEARFDVVSVDLEAKDGRKVELIRAAFDCG